MAYGDSRTDGFEVKFPDSPLLSGMIRQATFSPFKARGRCTVVGVNSGQLIHRSKAPYSACQSNLCSNPNAISADLYLSVESLAREGQPTSRTDSDCRGIHTESLATSITSYDSDDCEDVRYLDKVEVESGHSDFSPRTLCKVNSQLELDRQSNHGSLLVFQHDILDPSFKGVEECALRTLHSGLSRGNYSVLHRKAWLELADEKHRYGKHLRAYYKHWETMGCPTGSFFQWLDGTEESECPLPELEGCTRSQLDNDTVLYIDDIGRTRDYAIEIKSSNGFGFLSCIRGESVITGSEGWIFVIRDGVMYASPKVASMSPGTSTKRFHHSSFFGGRAVTAAGILITDEDGKLVKLYPHSGHYRPREYEMQQTLLYLEDSGVNLDTVQVDMQQLVHVNRQTSHEVKQRKTDTVYLVNGTSVADYLCHRARFSCVLNKVVGATSVMH